MIRSYKHLSILATLLTLCAGCAGLPTGGRVSAGRPVQGVEPFDDPYVRMVPVRPGRDWLPYQIVTGFLSASAGFDDRHAVAREYLDHQARWEPDPWPDVTVYADGSLEIVSYHVDGAQATVQVRGQQLGTIGPDGQYTAEPKQVDEIFRLVRNAHNQWRIAQLPEPVAHGLLLSRRDVDRAFRTMNLYFFAPDERVLVPNAIFLPIANRQHLPGQLVHALLKGPTSWLSDAVHTCFPQGTRLLRHGPQITNGVVTINLSREAARGDLAGMTAQLMWTLRQLRDVKSMKLEIDGKGESPPTGGCTRTPRDWQQADPDAATGKGVRPAYLRGATGRLGQLTDDSTSPLDTLEDKPLYGPAISLDQRVIAGLSATRGRVLMGDAARSGSSGRLHTVLRTGRGDVWFTSPSFDRNGTMWTVESAADRSWLWVKDPGKPAVRLPAPNWGLSGYQVRELRVALDGVRVAAIVVDAARHAQIRIGRIVRTGGLPTVGEFLPIGSELVDVTDFAWQNANELAVLGRLQRTTAEVLPYRVPVSGGKIDGIGIGAQGEMGSIAAAPNSPVLVSARVPGKDSRKDWVCRLSDPQDRFSEWDCFISGADPFYAG